MRNNKQYGFTLMEVLGAMVILVIAVTLALSGYIHLLKRTNMADVQHELDVDVQSAIEHLKVDLRLSSMDEIFGFPAGSPPFRAISFPIPKVDPNTGRLVRDDVSKKIIWDKTVVYHIVPGTPDHLTKTTFDYDPDLEDTQRQTQLNYIVVNGGTAGAPNVDNASSEVIFSNLLKWGLNPRGGNFSCYAATPGVETISLGYTLLEDDVNTLTFTAVDSQGSGYFLGIDQLLTTPSYRYREAELRMSDNVAHVGPNAPTISPKSSYGNRSQLLFDAAAANNSISLTFDNDRWELTDFGNLEGQGYMDRDQTDIKTDYANNDIVVKLEGSNQTWMAESQTAHDGGTNVTANLTGETISVLMKGGGVIAGNHLQYNGERCQITFRAPTNTPIQISNIWFGESVNPSNTTMSHLSSPTQVEFSSSTSINIPAGEARTSDWIDVPVDKDKNYLTTFTIDAATDMKLWIDYRAAALSSARTTLVGTNAQWYIPALESMTVSYVDEGTYTSDIMDTRLSAPVYNYISWKSDLPGDCTLNFKVRAGDDPALTNATAFSAITTTLPASSTESYQPISINGRYVQFQAIMTSDTATHLLTPVLKEIQIDWQGESRMVNIMGKFTKGPEFGDFELSLNGKPLQAALVVDLEIYKDTYQGGNSEKTRLSSAIKAEITPRNSGL